MPRSSRQRQRRRASVRPSRAVPALPPSPSSRRRPTASVDRRKPLPKPTPKPGRKPLPKPTRKPLPKPARKPLPKPARKPLPKPVRKPLPKPLPKPTRKPAKARPPKLPPRIRPPRVVGRTPIHRPIEDIRMVERTVYRDRHGHILSDAQAKQRRRALGRGAVMKTTYLYQLDSRGRVVRTLEKSSPHTVLKTVIPSRLGFFEAGQEQGLIYHALISSSITSALHRAKRVEVTLLFTNERRKSERIKLTLNLEQIMRRNEFPAALAGLIIEALRDRGYRTNYTIELFKAARARGLKHPITWDEWRGLRVADDLQMTVVLYT